jgi:hypothetical protein
MSRPLTAAERAARLLRYYPPAWRERYGEEFHELLVCDIAERPRSWRRTSDVVRGATVARLAHAGLGGATSPIVDSSRAGLASLACCAAAFVAFGATMWSQLTIGWQWSEPDTAATAAATVVTSIAMFALLALAAAAALPLLWSVVSRLVRRTGERLAAPAATALVGGTALFLGARHFGNGWPGTGGHPWSHQGLVPGGLAAFSWASTLSVSSYWAHPAGLARFPVTEVAWMALSPVAAVCLVVGAAKVVRRLPVSPQVLRYEAKVAGAAWATMAVFLTGCCIWVVDGGPGPRNLFHAGAIDVVGLVVMAMALTLALRALATARRGSRRLLAS